jgi:hypothetical protein
MGVCNIHTLLAGLRKDQPTEFFSYICASVFVLYCILYSFQFHYFHVRVQILPKKSQRKRVRQDCIHEMPLKWSMIEKKS